MSIRLFTLLFIIPILTGCDTQQQDANQTSPPATAQGRDENSDRPDAAGKLHAVVDKYTRIFMQQQPVLSTMLAVDPDLVGGPYNHRFPDYSPKGMAALQQSMNLAIQELSGIERDALNRENTLHLEVVNEIFTYYAGLNSFSGGYIDTWGGHFPYIINQISGPLIDIPKVMQVQQAVTNEQEAADYLTRLGAFNVLVDQVLEKFSADMQQGIVLPQKLYPKTVNYFDNFLASEPAGHELVTTFAKKLKENGFSTARQQVLVTQATALVKHVVYPAYQKARAAIVASEPKARREDGIWSQPNGARFYLHAIRYLGDTIMSAAEIHQIGLDEVARISTEMDTILKENGYSEGTVGERMVQLSKKPEFLYEDSAEGRQALLDDLNGQVAAVMEKAPLYYKTFPTQKVEVRRIPPVSEAGQASGFYTPPSLDGSRPGIFWVNLRDMAAMPRYVLKTLTYHEAVPGHHFQVALNLAQQDIGLMRQNAPFNAYAEGWALYSELVAKQIGMYENDPWGDLGRLQDELFRAVRLVVDTGLHYKKWSREQAIDYLHANSGYAMTEIVAEVERYMAWPGQALGYKLGMLQFVELRNWAAQQLGDKFDIREFHDRLLLPGARPMSIVRSDVEAWVRQLLADQE